jgi:hypothetical protein
MDGNGREQACSRRMTRRQKPKRSKSSKGSKGRSRKPAQDKKKWDVVLKVSGLFWSAFSFDELDHNAAPRPPLRPVPALHTVGYLRPSRLVSCLATLRLLRSSTASTTSPPSVRLCFICLMRPHVCSLPFQSNSQFHKDACVRACVRAPSSAFLVAAHCNAEFERA